MGPPTCLSHLLRDGLRLKVTCTCGHTAEPDILELREDVWRRLGGEETSTSLECCAARGAAAADVHRANGELGKAGRWALSSEDTATSWASTAS